MKERSHKLVGLIPAAGKGTRAYPYSHRTPKGMLPINGVPNIERLVTLMHDQMQIEEIYIVTGAYGDVIRDHLRDGSRFGARITYLQNDDVEKGWAWSVLKGQGYIRDVFCVMLSDECYVDSNHAALLDFPYENALATCAVQPVTDTRQIRKNYAIRTEGDRIVELIEHPSKIINNLLGLGTFVFHPRIFDHLATAYQESPGPAVDLITLLGRLCGQGETVKAFPMTGHYVNINDRDSLQLAKYYVRESGFADLKTTVLIYAEGDEENIDLTLNAFSRAEGVDHCAIILPHGSPHAVPGAEIIACPSDTTQYGEKIKYALERVPGDIIVLTEASYSFHARDLAKLRAYIKEADMVIGTRTTRQLIRQGANMRGIVRLANIGLAKLLELLWWRREYRFTDVGCTFRALWRSSYERIRTRLKAKGPEFSVEMMIELMRARERIIEVPVSYHGLSYSMYRKHQNLNTFFRMARKILLSRGPWVRG